MSEEREDETKRRRPDPTEERKGRRRQRNERGLPDDKDLRELALTYLQTQITLWPDLVKDGTIPGLDAVETLAEQFRKCFLDDETLLPLGGEFAISDPRWGELAAGYLRYSCDNSNPRSLDQQLRLELERARQNRHFISWSLVFADAAVTGTTADRRGYSLAKRAIASGRATVLYIDEIGRASRDAIEAMRLGRLLETKQKRLIGVSDGFDSAMSTSKLLLSTFGMLQEWFVDQLRSKVNRGMIDGFDRGVNLHPPSVGYKLVPAVDAQGRPIPGKDGKPSLKEVIDESEAPNILEAFELFALKRVSQEAISRRFNEKTVGGLKSWDASRISQLLRRRTYVGIEVYRQTYQTRDRDTGKVTVHHRPREEWKVRRMRNLQIIPWSLWKLTRARLAECKKANASGKAGGKARAALYPKVLIRPRCGSCGGMLTIGHSGDCSSMFCPNGRTGKLGCTFAGYKSARIIEQAILDELRARIVTPEFVRDIVAAANRSIAEESLRPQESVAPIEAEIRQTRAKRDRLVKLLEQVGEADLGALVVKVRAYERSLRELGTPLDESRARNTPPPPPLEDADAETMLADLRGLLAQELAIAAPLLADLTGPVVVEQRLEEGRPRPTWFARFTVDAVPILAKLAAARKDPKSGTWEYPEDADDPSPTIGE